MKIKKQSSSFVMNRSLKIRTVYRKKYPHGIYHYIINLCTEPKSKYNKYLDYILNSEDLIAFCEKSLKDCYKLKYRKDLYFDEVLTKILLTNEGDIMILKMCFPQFIYSIKKIELQSNDSST